MAKNGLLLSKEVSHGFEKDFLAKWPDPLSLIFDFGAAEAVVCIAFAEVDLQLGEASLQQRGIHSHVRAGLDISWLFVCGSSHFDSGELWEDVTFSACRCCP